jgi:hypothetical protein
VTKPTISWSFKHGQWTASITTTATFSFVMPPQDNPPTAKAVALYEKALRSAAVVIDEYATAAMKQMAEAAVEEKP